MLNAEFADDFFGMYPTSNSCNTEKKSIFLVMRSKSLKFFPAIKLQMTQGIFDTM